MDTGKSARWLYAFACVSVLLALTVPAAFAQSPTGDGSSPPSAWVEAGLCPPSIGFGETVQCSILSSGETDTYTFTASSGDKVLVRASKSSGSLWPGVRVYNAGNVMLCEADGSTTAEIASCPLADTGTYSIRVYDSLNGTNTGGYNLFLQRLNNPGSTVPIAFGQTLSGSILMAAQMDTYTFTAASGDKVLVRASKSSGGIWPGVRIYSPNGLQLCQATASTTAEIASCPLSDPGTYSILVYDSLNGTNTGGYGVFLQRLNNPGSTVPIAFGQTLTGSILMAAQMDTFTFTANSGDKVLVRASKSSGGLWPGVRIYSPSGLQLCQATASTMAEIASCPLPSTGAYSILVYDSLNGTNTGGYGVFLQRLNSPGSTVPIAFGQTLTGSILTVAQMDTYTFSAVAGDKILVRGSKSSGGLWPGVRVYSPSGLQLCQATASTTAEIASCPLTSTGTYSILVFDSLNGTNTGGYGVFLQRLNNPGGTVAIGFGQTLTGSLLTVAQMDTYKFAASAGDKVLVRASRSSSGLWPGIRVYNPAGLQICQADSSTTAEIASCPLSSTGAYSILVYDSLNGTNTGGYGIFLQRLNKPGRAFAISSGQTLPGSILIAGQMRTYTFSVPASGKALVRMTRTSGGLWPGIRVYSPGGLKLCEADASSIAEIPACALPSAGTYMILAYDSLSGSNTGGYRLCLDCYNFRSAGAQDGWVLESGETSNLGGTMDAVSTTLMVGDNAQDRQYRSILSFNTGVLPDNAVITAVTLKLRSAGFSGTNPFGTHGNLLVDVRKGAFSGNGGLQLQDFQAPAGKNAVMTILNNPLDGWYSRSMAAVDFIYINKTGLTQFRLRFAKDDNDDLGSDVLRFYSGNYATASLRPQLIIQYHLP